MPSTLVPSSNQEESVSWSLSATGFHSVSNQLPKVLWYNIMWFKHYVPRRAIIQWIAVWGRLSTKDRSNTKMGVVW